MCKPLAPLFVPRSGFVFNLAAQPFSSHMAAALSRTGSGELRVCADDTVALLKKLSALANLSEPFAWAEALAHGF